MISLSTRPRHYPRLNQRDVFLGQVRLAQGPPAFQQGTPQSAADQQAVNGAILQVSVSIPSAAAAAGAQGSAPQTFTAMIDSGASISCINTTAAQQLGLQQVSSTQLGGVGGTSEAPIYAAALNLTQFGVTVDPVQIAGVGNPLPGVDMLIGRDILEQLTFTYDGPDGTFNLQKTGQSQTPSTQNSVAAAPPTPGTVAQPMAPPQNLPQPPAAGGTILGMSPVVAVGAGVVGVGAVVGALFLFKVL
jgi:hypothetical protein